MDQLKLSFVLKALFIWLNSAVAATAIHAHEIASSDQSFGFLRNKDIELFKQSLSVVEQAGCRNDLNATLSSILNGQPWAIAMYDATVKAPMGVTRGLLHQFGHFDGCLRQSAGEHNVDSVPAKYCLVDVTLDGVTIPTFGRRTVQPSNSTVVHWGACVPASCGAADIAIYMHNLLGRQVAVDDEMCQIKAPTPQNITDGMIAYAYVICFFVVLALLSTLFHMYMVIMGGRGDDKLVKFMIRNENLSIFLHSFSVIENTKKMFQAGKDQLGLNCINGIKAISMLFIIIGHGLSFIYGGPVYNADFMSERVELPTFAFISNSLLFVDTFLLLSGFLFCRIMLIELERRRGKINPILLYAARYIRLTPAYMAIIGFYMTWFTTIGSGPIWQQRIQREQQRCIDSWWLNIMYINNYFNTDKLCMFQSWYLSVDSQLFFIAPICIYALNRSRKNGSRLLLALVAVTAVIPFVVTYLQNLDPTLLVFADEMTDLGRNPYYVGTYIKTHMRASAYMVGLLTGYIVHVMQEKRTQLTPQFVRIAWLLSTAIGAASMFTVSCFYAGHFTRLDATLYAGFHKLGWNLSVAWLVVATTTGHATSLRQILSSRIFAPISRLCYCAYLCNGIIELYHSSNIRTVGHINYINLINTTFGHILNTFLLAYVLCLLFESPTHALERIVARKSVRSERPVSKGQADSSAPSTSEEQVA